MEMNFGNAREVSGVYIFPGRRYHSKGCCLQSDSWEERVSVSGPDCEMDACLLVRARLALVS